MSEHLTQAPEQIAAPVETLDQAVERLAMQLEIVSADQLPADDLKLGFMVSKRLGGEGYIGYPLYSTRTPEYAIAVQPATSPEDQPVFDFATTELRADKDTLKAIARTEGRWWSGNGYDELVENHTTEAFRISEGEHAVDVLNCAAEPLTDGHQEALLNAFTAVANYTGNKIFDRVAGVLFCPADQFPPDIAGDYNPISGIVRVNIDSIDDDAHDTDLGRYAPYFTDGQTTWPEIIIAHELGHAMDINTVSEADAHGVEKETYQWMGFGERTNGFSAFDNKFGWTHSIEAAPGFDEPTWLRDNVRRIDPAQEIECREFAPTSYAHTHTKEDFAETFALAALGGDMSAIPKRHEEIIKTVQLAGGRAVHGPKRAALHRLDIATDLITPIEKIGLQVYVDSGDRPPFDIPPPAAGDLLNV